MRDALVLVLALLAGCSASHPSELEDFARLVSDGGSPAPGDLVLTFFEVGIGDATLVELPGGGVMLIDAGVGWQSRSILNYLETRGITELDALVLTHPHMDHYGGMVEILQAVHVNEFVWNGVSGTTDRFEALDKALAAAGVPKRIVRRGDTLDLDGQVPVEVLHPDDQAIGSRGDLNAGSVVLRLTYGARRALLMGDAENEEESRLIALEGEALRADVLKLGHHASLGSGSWAFLQTVRPKLAVAMGTEIIQFPLFFPRPTYTIRWRLSKLEAALVTTGGVGTVQAISDGVDLRWRMMNGD